MTRRKKSGPVQVDQDNVDQRTAGGFLEKDTQEARDETDHSTEEEVYQDLTDEDVVVDPNIAEDFKERQHLDYGRKKLIRRLHEHTSASPDTSAEDVDADWEDDDVGEESVGGENPTPDQDIVEEIGEAVGLTFEDAEPLDVLDKMAKRDRQRWELNPASSEEYNPEVDENEAEAEERDVEDL